jgi:hypothetical protein
VPALLLTCPDALPCNIGLEAEVNAQQLAALDGTVTQRGQYFVVELRDPVDAMLALRRLVDGGRAELTSFVGE